MQNCEQ